MSEAYYWSREDNRLPFPLVDQLAFVDEEIDAGWFYVTVICGSVSRRMTVSYLCEPLGALLDKLVHLEAEIRSGIGGSEDDNCYEIAWVGEPWCATWRFRGHGDRTVDVVLEDDSRGPLETLFRVRIRLSVLLGTVYELAKRVLQVYGLAYYRMQWIESEFPLRNFVLLHDLVVGEKTKIEHLGQDIQFLQRFVLDPPPVMPKRVQKPVKAEEPRKAPVTITIKFPDRFCLKDQGG